LRWWLIGLTILLFWRTKVYFTPHKTEYWMLLTFSFGLIGFFIWIAENISTFLGAWQYPDQADVWQLVHTSKISSWFLLFILSFIIVVNLKLLKQQKTENPK
jgi:uncharacterized membrane protein YoaT (DUF817 family)